VTNLGKWRVQRLGQTSHLWPPPMTSTVIQYINLDPVLAVKNNNSDYYIYAYLEIYLLLVYNHSITARLWCNYWWMWLMNKKSFTLKSRVQRLAETSHTWRHQWPLQVCQESRRWHRPPTHGRHQWPLQVIKSPDIGTDLPHMAVTTDLFRYVNISDVGADLPHMASTSDSRLWKNLQSTPTNLGQR